MTCTGWQDTVNQTTNFGRWNLLGRCAMTAGTSGTVTLTAPGGCTVVSDAIKFAYTANTLGLRDDDARLAATDGQSQVLGFATAKPWSNTFTRHPLTHFNLWFLTGGMGLSLILWILIHGSLSRYGKGRR